MDKGINCCCNATFQRKVFALCKIVSRAGFSKFHSAYSTRSGFEFAGNLALSAKCLIVGVLASFVSSLSHSPDMLFSYATS